MSLARPGLDDGFGNGSTLPTYHLPQKGEMQRALAK
jgi:hypothetical protein